MIAATGGQIPNANPNPNPYPPPHVQPPFSPQGGPIHTPQPTIPAPMGPPVNPPNIYNQPPPQAMYRPPYYGQPPAPQPTAPQPPPAQATPEVDPAQRVRHLLDCLVAWTDLMTFIGHADASTKSYTWTSEQFTTNGTCRYFAIGELDWHPELNLFWYHSSAHSIWPEFVTCCKPQIYTSIYLKNYGLNLTEYNLTEYKNDNRANHKYQLPIIFIHKKSTQVCSVNFLFSSSSIASSRPHQELP